MNRIPTVLIDRNTDLTLGKALRWLWRHAFPDAGGSRGRLSLHLCLWERSPSCSRLAPSSHSSQFLPIRTGFTKRPASLLHSSQSDLLQVISRSRAWDFFSAALQSLRPSSGSFSRGSARSTFSGSASISGLCSTEGCSTSPTVSTSGSTAAELRDPRKHSKAAHGNLHSDHASLHCVCDRIDDRHRPHLACPGSCNRGVRGLSCDLLIHFSCHSASTPRNAQIIKSANKSRVQAVQEGLGGIRDVLIDNAQNIYLHNFSKIDNRLRRAPGANFVARCCTKVHCGSCSKWSC